MGQRVVDILRAVDRVVTGGPWTIGGRTWQRLPCCTGVALCLLEWAGLAPEGPAWGPGSKWWADINIHVGHKPWSSTDAAEAFGFAVDELEVGEIGAAQLWEGVEDGTVDPGDNGHMILLQRLTTDGLYLVIDTTESRGWRWKVWRLSDYLAEWGRTWGGPVAMRIVRLRLLQAPTYPA